MKKIISILLAAVMLLSITALVGCAGCNEPVNPDNPDNPGNNPNNIQFEQVNETVYATHAVRVRSSASSASDDNIVATLVIGQSVIRTGYNSEWSRVLYNGNICFVASDYLSTTKPDGSNNGGDSTEPSELIPDSDFTPCDNEVLYVFWQEDDGTILKSGTVKVRDKADWGAAAVDYLEIGTEVIRIAVYYEKEGEITGMSKIKVGDKTYYISNRALNEKNYAAEADGTTTN